jgi:SAM-dependent methyltransferase
VANEYVAGTKPSRLLDVGCGDGALLNRLVARHPSLTAVGVDADVPLLRENWERFAGPRIAFQAGSAYELPFDDNCFPVVTPFEVLEHLSEPDRALQEIKRVCSSYLIASVPWEPWWRIGNMAKGRYLSDRGNTPGHVNNWTGRQFRRFLEQHGPVEQLSISPLWVFARIRLG